MRRERPPPRKRRSGKRKTHHRRRRCSKPGQPLASSWKRRDRGGEEQAPPRWRLHRGTRGRRGERASCLSEKKRRGPREKMTSLAARLALTLRSRSRVFQAIKTSTSSRLLEVEKPPRLSPLPPTALDCLHRTSPSQRGTRSAEQDTALSWSETFVAAIDRNRKKNGQEGQIELCYTSPLQHPRSNSVLFVLRRPYKACNRNIGSFQGTKSTRK